MFAQVQSVSLESLNRAIEPRQLTQELGGVLIYDHDEWIELRIAFESFLWDALDALDKFHDIEQQLSNENYAADCEQAKVFFLLFNLLLFIINKILFGL